MSKNRVEKKFKDADFIFEISEELINNRGIDFDVLNDIYQEFIEYKVNLANEDMPCPKIEKQIQEETCVFLFGRDKLNDHPYERNKKEGIHHVHIFDPEEYEISEWNALKQFERTSDNFIIYSYFKIENNLPKYYFYVLDYIILDEDTKKGGHEAIKNKKLATKWLKIAKEFRLKELSKKD